MRSGSMRLQIFANELNRTRTLWCWVWSPKSEELHSSNDGLGGKQPGYQETAEMKYENKLCRPRELKLGHARASQST